MAFIIESLNIGTPKEEHFPKKTVTTGICKTPVDGPISLTVTGFAGDGVADRKHHGGTDKAVCVYSLDHYGYWENMLGIKLSDAAFGENFSVSGLKEGDVCIGDIFKVGSAVVQISQPRQPCKTLAARYGRDDFVKLVIESGYTGFYFKVIEEGEVKRGDKLILQQRDPRNITVAYANHTFHHDRKNCVSIKKVLDVPALSESWRQSFGKLLENCG